MNREKENARQNLYEKNHTPATEATHLLPHLQHHSLSLPLGLLSLSLSSFFFSLSLKTQALSSFSLSVQSLRPPSQAISHHNFTTITFASSPAAQPPSPSKKTEQPRRQQRHSRHFELNFRPPQASIYDETTTKRTTLTSSTPRYQPFLHSL